MAVQAANVEDVTALSQYPATATHQLIVELAAKIEGYVDTGWKSDSSSLTCKKKYMTIDTGGYVYGQLLRINCSICLDASQRSRDCV